MTLVQGTPVSHYFEPPAASDTLPARAFLQRDGSGDFILATTGAEDVVLVPDESGDYVIVTLDTPTLIVADGLDYGFGSSSAVAQLVDDSGDVTLGTDFSVVPVAYLGQDLDGNICMVRNGGPQLLLIAVGGDYVGFTET
jgi:hypothetical protein